MRKGKTNNIHTDGNESSVQMATKSRKQIEEEML